VNAGDDDPDHPIPSLSGLDFVAQRRLGGADLGIIIATPLDADERSQQRLLDKIELYLRFISSAEFQAEFGAPDPSTTQILVAIHAESHPAIFDLLNHCQPWAAQNRAALVIERRPGA
jgi:hypothetical protein